jgi:phosphoacetylglucosamine mutase
MLYKDLPSKQLKVPFPNKDIIKCSDDEMRVESPAEMQAALDLAIKSVPCGRCFVRPSGTEDVVRIYAEAASNEDAIKLADEALDIIKKFS